MINCQGLPQTTYASLKTLLDLLLALLSKGLISAENFDSIYNYLKNILQAQYAAGASTADMQSIVNKYLGAAVANANATTTSTSAAQTSFGTNVASGSASSIVSALAASSSGSFFDSTRTDPTNSYTAASGVVPSQTTSSTNTSSTSYIGKVAVGGLAVTTDELNAYFNNYVSQDDDSFAIILWIGAGKNPMLMLDALSYANRIHTDIIIPLTSYYKGIIYGDKNYKIRLGNILYGIVANSVVTSELRGGPPSRHLLGQACNFSITGVENAKVAEDLDNAVISCDYGTLAVTAGVHISLPFYAANGETIRHLRLWNNSGVPDFVGYKFT